MRLKRYVDALIECIIENSLRYGHWYTDASENAFKLSKWWYDGPRFIDREHEYIVDRRTQEIQKALDVCVKEKMKQEVFN